MKELGIVDKLKGRQAVVIIKRHAACGDCGACQVGEDKMSMKTLATNEVGAQAGDCVAVEMTFGNVMKATGIAYGLPLVGFLLGCFGGWFWAGTQNTDQVLTAFIAGIGCMAVAFLVILILDRKGRFGKNYEPVITGILEADDPMREALTDQS